VGAARESAGARADARPGGGASAGEGGGPGAADDDLDVITHGWQLEYDASEQRLHDELMRQASDYDEQYDERCSAELELFGDCEAHCPKRTSMCFSQILLLFLLIYSSFLCSLRFGHCEAAGAAAQEGWVVVAEESPRGAAAGAVRESTLAAALGALERGSGDVDIGGSFLVPLSPSNGAVDAQEPAGDPATDAAGSEANIVWQGALAKPDFKRAAQFNAAESWRRKRGDFPTRVKAKRRSSVIAGRWGTRWFQFFADARADYFRAASAAEATEASRRGRIDLREVVAVHASTLADAPLWALDLVIAPRDEGASERVVTLGCEGEAGATRLRRVLRTLIPRAAFDS